MTWSMGRKLMAVIVAAALAQSVAWAGGVPCPPVPCAPAPAPVVKKKVMVTEYKPQPYETTRTVYKTEYKEEKFTAYRCENVTEQKTRMVTVNRVFPVTVNQEVTRYECVPTQEEKTITRYVVKQVPVQQTVSRCVDAGGHYECKEVPCGGRKARGCFRHRGCDCCDDYPPPTKTVSVYVPNYKTVQTPVTVMKCVTEPVTEKVKVTVNKMVAKKETIKVTRYECKPETHEEKYTVCSVKRTPYEATRKVAVCVPVQEKVTLMRMVPVQVEKEVVVSACATCCDDGCGSDCY
jgi:hypothetical protein